MRRAIIRAATDPGRKQREKDEKEQKKKEKEEKKQEKKEKRHALTHPWEKYTGGGPKSAFNEVPSIPLPDKLDPYNSKDMFRARILTRHKTFLAVTSTMSLTYTEQGSVWEFIPSGGAGEYFISAFVHLAWLQQPLCRAYLHADGSEGNKLRVQLVLEDRPPRMPLQSFRLQQIKKNVCSILHLPSGKILCAEDHCVKVNRDKPGDWEKFTVEPANEKVPVRAVTLERVFANLEPTRAHLRSRRHGKLVGSTDQGDTCFLDKKDDEEVELIPGADGTTLQVRSFKTGRWWFVDTADGGAVKLRDNNGDDFRLEGDWNETAAFRHVATGKLVCAEANRLQANKDNKGEWETFTFEQ